MPTSYESLLKPAIVADAATFADTWGESVTRRIGGDSANTSTLNAVVDEDNEDEGEALDLESAEGNRIRRFIRLEVPAAQAIQISDTFVIASESDSVWSVRRILNRDDGMKTVQLTRTENQTSREARTRPT